jgi:hypothetical protein
MEIKSLMHHHEGNFIIQDKILVSLSDYGRPCSLPRFECKSLFVCHGKVGFVHLIFSLFSMYCCVIVSCII